MGKTPRGMTLIEIMTVVGIIAIIAAVSFFMLAGRRNTTDLKSTVQQMTSLLRQAQSRSISQASNTTWGVHFDNGVASATPFYALFSSGAYSTSAISDFHRLPTDVCYVTSSIAQASSVNVIFNLFSGTPSAATATSIALVLSPGCNVTSSVARPILGTSTITVSAQGLVSF